MGDGRQRNACVLVRGAQASINLPGGPRDYCLPAGIREHERERERERERESSREMAVLVGAQGMQTQRCRRE